MPGINPNRADVIIAGAAILQTIMEEQGFESVTISNRNLQNGILVDYLMRTHPQKAGARLSTREESVLQLARFCRFEEKHSRHIAKLALELFDSARAIGLHDAPPVSRELLYYAALLHDIGIFISFANHNAHSHYLIRNTELLGFTEREIELIAALDHHPAAMPPAGDLPLCFRFIILCTMLRQSFNVPLPEDIPDQRSQFHSVSLKPVAKSRSVPRAGGVCRSKSGLLL